MYLFDYTNLKTREYWADSVAAIYNEAGAVCGQWDGSEYQASVAGWGVSHSAQTWSAGADALFWATLGVAAEESRRQWKEDVAVEFSLSIYGDGPYKGDMMPFGDEPPFAGGRCSTAAETWCAFIPHTVYVRFELHSIQS